MAEQQDRDLTLDTYRYLRGGMVVMVVLLAAGVIGAAVSSQCWQGSISEMTTHRPTVCSSPRSVRSVC